MQGPFANISATDTITISNLSSDGSADVCDLWSLCSFPRITYRSYLRHPSRKKYLSDAIHSGRFINSSPNGAHHLYGVDPPGISFSSCVPIRFPSAAKFFAKNFPEHYILLDGSALATVPDGEISDLFSFIEGKGIDIVVIRAGQLDVPSIYQVCYGTLIHDMKLASTCDFFIGSWNVFGRYVGSLHKNAVIYTSESSFHRPTWIDTGWSEGANIDILVGLPGEFISLAKERINTL